MKYKLKDIQTKVVKDVTTGTCELCMSPPFDDTIHTYVFEDEEGTIYEIEDKYWNWGWASTSGLELENICEFAMWLKDVDVQEPPTTEPPRGDFEWLSNLVGRFWEAQGFLEGVSEWDDEDWHLYEYAGSYSNSIEDMGVEDIYVINPGYLEHSPAEAHKDGFAEGSYDKFVAGEDLDEFQETYNEWQETLKMYRDGRI